MTRSSRSDTQLLVVGAGPTGLAVGIAAAKAGISCILLDRATVVSAIEKYPLGMTFFSTPERIEIGGIPLVTSSEKPTRRDGLIYYRRVAEHYHLDIRVRETVTAITREADGTFLVSVRRPHDEVTLSCQGGRDRHRLLRPAQCAGRAGRGPAARESLLRRGPPSLAPEGGDRRRRQLGGGCGARELARRRRGHDDPARRQPAPHREGVGAAGHHQSPHRGQHPGPLSLARPRASRRRTSPSRTIAASPRRSRPTACSS